MEYRCISADSHLEVRPDRYTPRIPAKYRDRAPKVITLEDGTLAVLQEGKPFELLISSISCGKPYEERHPFDPLPGDDYDTSPGTGTPERRLEEQDTDGVDAEVLFPGNVGPNFWRGIKSDEAFKAVVRAFNDWLAEEYCQANPDRLIGLGVIPMTNLEDAIEELRHCKKIGLKGVVMNSFPSCFPHTVPEDDRFYEEALDLEMPLTIHVAFGFPQRGAPPPRKPAYDYPKMATNLEIPVPDMVDRINKYGFRGAIQAVQLMFSGVFDRFPNLKIYIAEVQIGWLPHWMDQLDNEYGRQRYWIERVLGVPQLPRPLSEYAREHFFWGFNRNPAGVRIAKAELGLDKVMWASDFPHLESDWPNSRKVIDECCKGLDESEKRLVTVDNAVNYFHLNGG